MKSCWRRTSTRSSSAPARHAAASSTSPPQGSRQEHPHRHRLAVQRLVRHITAINKRVIVLGGGNTAMDCCRTARPPRRRRCQSDRAFRLREMKASPWEKEDAIHEDIPILNFMVPKEFTHDNGKLTGVLFEKVKGGPR